MAIDVKTQIIHHKDSQLAWLIKHEREKTCGANPIHAESADDAAKRFQAAIDEFDAQAAKPPVITETEKLDYLKMVVQDVGKTVDLSKYDKLDSMLTAG